jgi:hypothetical protein
MGMGKEQDPPKALSRTGPAPCGKERLGPRTAWQKHQRHRDPRRYGITGPELSTVLSLVWALATELCAQDLSQRRPGLSRQHSQWLASPHRQEAKKRLTSQSKPTENP